MSQIIGTSGISIEDGQGGYIALSVREKVLSNLKQGLTTFAQARSPYSGDFNGNGTLYYRIPLYGSTTAYSQGQVVNVNPSVDNISVNISDYRTQFFEIEDFDPSMITDGNALVGMISANLTSTIMADMNAHFYLGLKKYFDAHPEQTLCIPKLVSEDNLTEEELRKLQKDLMTAKARMSRIISKKYIGVSANEFNGLIDNFGSINLNILLTRLNASNKAFDTIIKGADLNNLDVIRIGGTNFVIDNFINAYVPQGTCWNGDYDYDMSSYLGFIIHQDFAAFPAGLKKIAVVQNTNNANFRTIAKYCFGFGILRPELGTAFVRDVKIGVVNAPKNYYVGDVVYARVNTIGETITINEQTNLTAEPVANDPSLFKITFTAAGAAKFSISAPAAAEKNFQVQEKA